MYKNLVQIGYTTKYIRPLLSWNILERTIDTVNYFSKNLWLGLVQHPVYYQKKKKKFYSVEVTSQQIATWSQNGLDRVLSWINYYGIILVALDWKVFFPNRKCVHKTNNNYKPIEIVLFLLKGHIFPTRQVRSQHHLSSHRSQFLTLL